MDDRILTPDRPLSC